MTNIIEFIDVCYSEPSGFGFVNLNFSIVSGEVLVVSGVCRDEESVLPKLCAGLITPSSGLIKLFGAEIGKIQDESLSKLRSENMGFVFAKSALFNNMRVKDNVALPLRYHTILSEEQISKKVDECLNAAGILEVADKFPSDLPAGIQKIVSVLRADIMDPQIIFYDDPIFELDKAASSPVVNIIKSISRDKNTAALIFTCRHEPAWDFAGRTLLIDNNCSAVCGAERG